MKDIVWKCSRDWLAVSLLADVAYTLLTLVYDAGLALQNKMLQNRESTWNNTTTYLVVKDPTSCQ